MRFIIIGLGFIAPRHIEAIKHVGGELVAVCDIDPSRKIKGVPFYTDYKKALDLEADWVSICTPNFLHFEMIAHAIKIGKKVICEKPLVLSTRELNLLPKENVFTVLQLRNHREIMHHKANFKPKNGELIVKVKRDQSYWDGWKGDSKRSGGILFNLGIHYFDLLLLLYGDSYHVLESEYSNREATGLLRFGNYTIRYEFKIMDTNEDQTRKLIIGNEVIQLSNKDNLSFEDLHKSVYEDVMNGRGITPKEASRAIRLVEFLI